MNDNSLILGPLAIFPEIILAWNINSTKDINEATLSLFTILYPTLDLLILGLESNYEYIERVENNVTSHYLFVLYCNRY